MALVKFILADIKGKVGGVVFGNGCSGPTLKVNTIPVISMSENSISSRHIFGYLSSYFSTLLSSANRDAWVDFANNSPLTNKWGDPFFPSGLNCFIRHNIGLIIADKAVQEIAPANYGWRIPGLIGSGANMGDVSDQSITFSSVKVSGLVSGETLNIYQSESFKLFGDHPRKFKYLTSIDEGESYPITVDAVFPLDTTLSFILGYMIVGPYYGYSDRYNSFCTSQA